jgi:DNA repair exonuclease SbcCD ATPase subunit
MTGIAFVVAVIALILAVVFYLQARSAAEAVLGLKAEADAARKATDEARAQLRDAQAEAKARSAQMVELREKMNELRKRGQDKVQPKRGAREAELEEDLEHARRLLAEAHAAEQQARKDAAVLSGELGSVRAELERAQARAREAAAAPAPQPPPVDESKLREAEQRAARAEKSFKEAEGALRQQRDKERALREELKKARGRAETNNRVYLVTKGELEIVRERLAQAEKALWKAGLPVPTPRPKERPRATGPAAADRDRAEIDEGAVSERPEPIPAEPPSAGAEPISAAASQPNGVEVRRSAESDAKPAH